MVEQVRLLQAEIRTQMAEIDEAYEHLTQSGPAVTNTDKDIIIAYYLNVIYGLFETTFEQVAARFGNQVTDQARWHSQLLRRMTLDVQTIRPPVISQESYKHLDELRAFRHLFRNAYLLQFDPKRLDIALQHALALRKTYATDFEGFLTFLDTLAQDSN